VRQGANPGVARCIGSSGRPSRKNGYRRLSRTFCLLGFPAYPSEKLPALGTRGDLLLIAPGFYVIGDRGPNPGGDLEVSVSAKPAFLRNQLTLRIVKRVDDQPWLNGPITLADAATQVNPFVVLN
jgi:hypothetical protein